MTTTVLSTDRYRLGDLEVPRLGYGAMQLAGPGVSGPPRDRDEAVAVLRAAYDLGVRHIDTSDSYGPTVTNELIREALSPYPDDLAIVTKVGARRGAGGEWILLRTPEDLRNQVHDNLRHLGVEALDVVNLRLGGREGQPDATVPGSVADQFATLAELREQGLIRHLGLSTVDVDQLEEARTIAPVVCVQNFYNLVHREDEPMLRRTAELGIAYVPYFPLGGFTPLQSGELDRVAADLDATAMQVALAWLLQRSSNLLAIPGTSSLTHLRENVGAAGLELPADVLPRLDALA